MLGLDTSESCKACAATRAESDEFEYRASHDLRAPARQAGAFIELLSDRLSDNTDPDVQKWLAFASQSTRRLERIISGLLDFSRASRAVAEETSFDASRIARAVVQSRDAEIDRLKATVELAPSLPNMYGSAAAFGQVLGILIDNALKFSSPSAPEISIQVGESSGSLATIHIQDKGQGFDPNQAEEVFEPFRSLGGGSQTEAAGMGLAVARRLVEANGGEIWGDAQVGQGAVFTVQWPTNTD